MTETHIGKELAQFKELQAQETFDLQAKAEAGNQKKVKYEQKIQDLVEKHARAQERRDQELKQKIQDLERDHQQKKEQLEKDNAQKIAQLEKDAGGIRGDKSPAQQATARSDIRKRPGEGTADHDSREDAEG